MLRNIFFVTFLLSWFLSVFAGETSKGQDPNTQKKHLKNKIDEITKQENESRKERQVKNDESESFLIPHQSSYDIIFDSKENQNGDASIRDIQGKMTIKLVDAGDGWIYEQHTILFIYFNGDEPAEQIRTTVVAWESKDGERYDFKVRTFRNGQEENISGKAYAPKNLVGFVEMDKPDFTRFDLPQGTMFPISYLLTILKASHNGDVIVPSRPLFDVSNENLETVNSMASISTPFQPRVKLFESNKSFSKAWKVKNTMFSHSGDSPDDNFEMKQTILSNGIIASMTMDLGRTNTKFVLKKVEILSNQH